MSEPDAPDTLPDDLRTAWHRYVDMLVPLRPALYSYCRRLAGTIWDAEDLGQERCCGRSDSGASPTRPFAPRALTCCAPRPTSGSTRSGGARRKPEAPSRAPPTPR